MSLMDDMASAVRDALQKHGQDAGEEEWCEAAAEALDAEKEGIEMRLSELQDERANAENA